jgi:hypothetical protein
VANEEVPALNGAGLAARGSEAETSIEIVSGGERRLCTERWDSHENQSKSRN